MAKLEADGPNKDQITAWNAELGEKFIKYHHALDQMISPFGAEAMKRLNLTTGDCILDIGCGCGETSIAMARKVGAKGEVVGADISEIMLARAEDAAVHAEVTNVFFEQADVQTSSLHPRTFDAAFSRFGVMFFADPVAAFTNVYEALHDGGRLAFACWRPLGENPWMAKQLEAVAPMFELPPPPPPDAPGPFSFGDPERVKTVLSQAGFEKIETEEFTTDLILGGTRDLDEAAEFAIDMGPVSFLLKEMEADEATRRRAFEAVREALKAFHTGNGVALGASAWIVSASKP